MDSQQQDRLSRRGVLRLTCAGAAGVWAGGLRALGAAEAVAVRPEAPRKKIPIALQLYSVRMECSKDKGKHFPKVVEAVAKMGYEGVEFAGYYGYQAKDLKKILDDNGLKCAGTHTGLGTLQGKNLAKTIEFHKTIGNQFLIVPGLPRKNRASAEAWLATAKLFNGIAEQLKPHGMHTGYHNHSHEFKPMNGQVPWDIFFSNTHKEVVMQLDTGNCMGGGGDPVAILKKYPGRAATVHMKERGHKAVLGGGQVQWKEVVTLCQTTGGTEWYIIEQESYPYPPMETVKRCLDGLKKILASV
jgi:sugar phosphate isomerase/epimerase